jgi:hypothetical protein
LADLRELVSSEFAAHRADMQKFGQELRASKKRLGPRQRTALLEHILNQDVGQSMPTVQELYRAAGHKDNETRPCAACRFLKGGQNARSVSTKTT